MSDRRRLRQSSDRKEKGLHTHLPCRLRDRENPANRADQSIESYFPVGGEGLQSARGQTTGGGKKGESHGKIEARAFLA